VAEDDVHRIAVRAQSLEELRSFLDGADFDFGCRPIVRREGDEYVVEVYAPMRDLEKVRSTRAASHVSINVIENASEVGRARQAEVGSSNRSSARQPLRGLGLGRKE
jgi:hypothetical protein